MESRGASLWDEAVWRASLSWTERPSQTTSVPNKKLPTELQRLVSPLEKAGNAFDAFRAKFLRQHGKALLDSLNQCTIGRTLTPASLASQVQERFLAACGQEPTDLREITPGFHGTHAAAYDSIFARGLLVPGDGNELGVRNGSAHGKGIYIAKLSNPWLSQGFAYGTSKMLVCG